MQYDENEDVISERGLVWEISCLGGIATFEPSISCDEYVKHDEKTCERCTRRNETGGRCSLWSSFVDFTLKPNPYVGACVNNVDALKETIRALLLDSKSTAFSEMSITDVDCSGTFATVFLRSDESLRLIKDVPEGFHVIVEGQNSGITFVSVPSKELKERIERIENQMFSSNVR